MIWICSLTMPQPNVLRRDAHDEGLSFAKTEASVLLDLVRGLAAVLVLGEHWRNLLFIDYPQLVVHRFLLLVPYLVTSAGHQAVVIFFVLSGYLISGSVFRMLDRGQWSWRLYLTHRLVRLWLVLLPGLVLCVLWDSLGLRLHHAPLTYAGLVNDHMLGNVRSVLTPSIFFGNVFFLQTIHFPTLGSDGALWSLANEFWYYILFPLGLMVVLRRSSLWLRVGCAALFLGVAWYVGRGIFLGFPIWLVGTLLALVKPPRVDAAVRWVVAVFYTLLVFFLAKYRGPGSGQSDYALAVATFLMLSARREADSWSWPVRVSRTLSRFSFTLYVAHTPFLLLLVSLAAGDTRWTPTTGHVLAGCGLLLAALLYAYALAWLTEFRTDPVRRWVERKLGLARRPQPNPHEKVLFQ